MVEGDGKGRVFVRQTMQGLAKFFIVGHGFRFNGNADHRGREFHCFEMDFILLCAEGVPGFGGVEPGNSNDISGHRYIVGKIIYIHSIHRADDGKIVWIQVKRK